MRQLAKVRRCGGLRDEEEGRSFVMGGLKEVEGIVCDRRIEGGRRSIL